MKKKEAWHDEDSLVNMGADSTSWVKHSCKVTYRPIPIPKLLAARLLGKLEFYITSSDQARTSLHQPNDARVRQDLAQLSLKPLRVSETSCKRANGTSECWFIET